jgi:hypothetical protein
MPRATVSEVLCCLEDEFAEFAGGFCRGEYLLWLGSGISRDVVPGVPMLLQHMLEFVRVHIDGADPACRFRQALEDVLEVAGVPSATRAALDLASPVATWTGVDDIVNRLVDRYSDVLNVQVHGEAEDFLVWDGLDVPQTYGAPHLEPDVEHLCVAILMLEGVVRSAPTTNWDGLVEKAMQQLVGDADRVLRVIVAPVDFREPERQAELVKFHGCAVRAAADEGEYRDRLIARKEQVSGWTTRPENQLMKGYLEHLFATRSAFIVGLSAQDANIHTVLHQATQNLVRTWPESPPAVVFAEQGLHHHHRLVLQVTYGSSYAANASEIADASLLGAFAKPALVALVLFALADKLCILIGCVAELTVPPADLERIRADVRSLRDIVGAIASSNPRALVDELVVGMAFLLMVFRSGRVPDPANVLYQPLAVAPIATALESPDFPSAALGRLAVLISLLGRGRAEGLWDLGVGTPASPSDGVVSLDRGHRTTRLFVVSTARPLTQLEADGVVDPDDDDVLVVKAEAALPPSTRSPRPRYGRTGATGARYIDLEGLCATVSSADDLFEAFILEGAL